MAKLDERGYELEITLRMSAAGNPFYITREYRIMGPGEQVRTPEEKYQGQINRLLGVLRSMEAERDSLVEELHRAKSTIVQLSMDYDDMCRAYRAELNDANSLRQRLGIPLSVDNIVQFHGE